MLNDYLHTHGLPQRVRVLYSDNEGTSSPLEKFLMDMNIAQRFSVAGSQHQNALAENNGGWQLFTSVRHDLDLSNMSKGFRRACIRLNVERRAYTPRLSNDFKIPF